MTFLKKLRIAWAFYGMHDWPDDQFIIGWRRAWQIAETIGEFPGEVAELPR